MTRRVSLRRRSLGPNAIVLRGAGTLGAGDIPFLAGEIAYHFGSADQRTFGTRDGEKVLELR